MCFFVFRSIIKRDGKERESFLKCLFVFIFFIFFILRTQCCSYSVSACDNVYEHYWRRHIKPVFEMHTNSVNITIFPGELSRRRFILKSKYCL